MFSGGKQLDEQVEKILRATKTDAGAPFEEVNMAYLGELKVAQPAEFQRARAAFKKLKVNMKAFDAEVDQHRPRLRVVQPDETSDENIRERNALRAVRIIECDDVLKLFLPEFAKLIAGEERNGQLLYLIGTSRLFRKPMNCAIKGVSSGGKSEVRDATLKFFPEDQIINYTAMSQKAMLRDDRPYAHRILSLGEAAGVEDASFQDYLIRELISSGRLTYASTEKNEVTGRLEAVQIVKDGPVSFMITTTRNSLHPENETRLLSLEIDDSKEQTKRVMEFVALMEGEGFEPELDLGEWHAFQEWLATGSNQVAIPWARHVIRLVPPAATRLRRDVGQILRAVKVHALINQSHRKTDERGRIVAEIETDYRAVYNLMADMLAEASGISVTQRVIDAALAVSALEDPNDEKKGVPTEEIREKLNCDKSVAKRHLRGAEAAGFVTNLETRRQKEGRWRSTGKSIDNQRLLPDWEEIHESWNSRPT